MLSVLIFTTSAGLYVDIHFCSGKIKSFSLFGKAKNCYELASGSSTKSCLHNNHLDTKPLGCSVEKKDCCTNNSLHFKSSNIQVTQNANIALSQSLIFFVASFIEIFFLVEHISESISDAFILYIPPTDLRDIYALYQTYLL